MAEKMAGSVPHIRQLDEVVVNRIAAGEVILRPANAIKEMIENSIDAGSKNIQVTLKSGGLKLIQIQDDGCGIQKEDLAIVCKRFTTSKLEKFDDLKSIQTYGFRGEALASISHIAHVAITTKTAQGKCAYKAKYQDGCLMGEPKACAGNSGTQIVAEDLFYNVSVRRKTLKSASEEHAKVVDVISKYAIHNEGVGFTLKKHGETLADVRTMPKSSKLENIKTIHGATVAKELLEVELLDEKLNFKMNGYISNANYSVKKLVFLLFINNRLVDCTTLRKAIEVVYVNYLPKDKHPFVYISLNIATKNIDVNVHPTKHEVHFLHEDLIIESIQKAVDSKLLGANESRHYYTQMLIPTFGSTTVADITDSALEEASQKSNVGTKEKIYSHQMVRTDAREQKIDAFYEVKDSKPQNSHESEPLLDSRVNVKTKESSSTGSDEIALNLDGDDDDDEGLMEVDLGDAENQCQESKPRVKRKRADNSPADLTSGLRREIRLTSVKNLRKSIDEKEHPALKALLEDHIFVGCVERCQVLLQHSTKLYLANTTKLTKELFYQIIIFKFGNFGFMRLTNPAPIYDLALMALEHEQSGWTQSDGPKEELAKYVADLLKTKADMLLDYFSIEIDSDGNLLAIPLLLKKYNPDLYRLPMFLLKIATDVNWDAEEECFHTIADVCSTLFAFGPNPLDIKPVSNDEDTNISGQPVERMTEDGVVKDRPWKWIVEHVLFPALRHGLLPPKSLSEDGTILQVANLPELYKVFERC